MSEYYVYILQCVDNSYYTGIARDLAKRLLTHQSGAGSKYVASRLPFTLVYSEMADSRSDAQKREFAIRKMSVSEKEALIAKARQQ